MSGYISRYFEQVNVSGNYMSTITYVCANSLRSGTGLLHSQKSWRKRDGLKFPQRSPCYDGNLLARGLWRGPTLCCNRAKIYQLSTRTYLGRLCKSGLRYTFSSQSQVNLTESGTSISWNRLLLSSGRTTRNTSVLRFQL